MRILLISGAWWPDHTGGISKSLYAEVKTLVAQGHDVTVITRALRTDFPAIETRPGFRIIRYPSPRVGSAFYYTYPVWTLIHLRRLLTSLNAKQFDIAYVHEPFQMLAISGLKSSPPVVYCCHAPMPEELLIDIRYGKYGLSRWLVRALLPTIRAVEATALRRAAVVLVRSRYIENLILSIYPNALRSKRVVRLPLGIELERFPFTSDPKQFRRKLGLPQDVKILLTIRRLTGRMGLLNLLDAMTIVLTSFQDVLLLIGGRGYLQSKLQQRIKESRIEQHVCLLGFVAEEDLPDYYRAADLFVLPTETLEGFGLVTLEALSSGTPVVATPVGANTEILKGLDGAFLAKSTDSRDLAEAIKLWLSKDIAVDIRQRCREYCERYFEIHKITIKLVELFESIRKV